MTGDSHYKPQPVDVDATVIIQGSKIGGFMPATAGTITITTVQEGVVTTVLPTITVVAGQLCELPIFVGTLNRSTLVAAGGASGILLVT
jgi:hypothetical protein